MPADTKAFSGFAVDDLAKARKSRSTTSTRRQRIDSTPRAFERYDGFEQDEKGISRGRPLTAMFKDPPGNALSVLQET